MTALIVRFRDEQLVNTFTLGAQEAPSVTALSGGGWLVTWVSQGQDKAGSGIYQQRYNADGSLDGIETRVTPLAIAPQRSHSVTALKDGGWVVTWVSADLGGASGGIYQQRYNAKGLPQDGEQIVNSHTPGAQELPSVTALDDGGWVVTWQSDGQDGDGNGIYLQQFDKNGVANPKGEQMVNDTGWGNQTNPSVTALTGGGWVVTWQLDNDLYQRFFKADGTPTLQSWINIDAVYSNERMPSVTALANGGWVVVWQSSKDDSGWEIHQQRFDADGDTETYPEQRVNTRTGQDQDAPSVTGLADGGWVVTWQSDGQDGSGKGIYQQRYRADGTPVDEELQVNVHTGLDQRAPSVTALDDGSWVVTWQSDGQDGNGNGIYQRFYEVVDAFGDGREHGYGSGDSEIFRVSNGGLGAGDSLEAGGGIDIVRMIEAGTLDLTAPALLTGVEIVQGSSGNDVIVTNATRLAAIAGLQGGAGFDELRLVSGSYDLTGNVLAGFEAITLSGPGTLTFADKATALLARSQTKDGSVTLSDDSFTLAERTQLYNQGIRKVTDAGGVHILQQAQVSLSMQAVEENAGVGTTIGTLSATDPNPGDGLRFEMIDSAGGRFALSGNQLVVANGSSLDYETGASHRVVVRAIDDGGIATDAAFTITLSDVPVETIKGTSRADVLKGSTGKDVLFGGLGKDTLSGDKGQDIFAFDTKPNKSTNLDRITDFVVKDDSIWLDNKIFTKFGKAGTVAKPSALNKSFFATDKAKDKNDYLIYSKKTGTLSYDADGSGSKYKAIEIALLKKGLGLTTKDFFVI